MREQCSTCDGTGEIDPAEVLDRSDFDDVVTALIAAANDIPINADRDGREVLEALSTLARVGDLAGRASWLLTTELFKVRS